MLNSQQHFDKTISTSLSTFSIWYLHSFYMLFSPAHYSLLTFSFCKRHVFTLITMRMILSISKSEYIFTACLAGKLVSVGCAVFIVQIWCGDLFNIPHPTPSMHLQKYCGFISVFATIHFFFRLKRFVFR